MLKKFKVILALLIFAFVIQTVAQSANAQQEKDAIIIIPGIMSSWNWKVLFGKGKNVWRFPPTVKTYDSLIKYFKDQGHEEGKNLFVFFYDWRQRNQESAAQLKNLVQTAKDKNPSSEVTIIAHSMGGLVARSYMQGDVEGFGGDVNKLLMLGTPNYGSSDVYTLWQGGEVPNNWEAGIRNFIKGYLWFLNKSFSLEKHYQTIHDKIPSIEQLLPTYDYLTDANTGANRPEPSNFFLETRNEEDQLEDFIQSTQLVATIAGDGQNTVNNIPVIDDLDAFPRWQSGRPEPNPPARNDPEGDNRVLLSSAHIPALANLVYDNQKSEIRMTKSESNPKPEIRRRSLTALEMTLGRLLHFVRNDISMHTRSDNKVSAQSDNIGYQQVNLDNVGHGELPHQAIPKIAELLGETILVDPIAPKMFDKSLAVLVASPVEVQVIDPNGKKIDKFGNAIPDAEYDDDGEPNGKKMIIIPDPIDGDYQISLTPIGEGGLYQFGTLFLNGEAEDNQTSENEISIGFNHIYDIAVESLSNNIEVEKRPPTDRELAWQTLRVDSRRLLPTKSSIQNSINKTQKNAEKTLGLYQTNQITRSIYDLMIRSPIDGILRRSIDTAARRARLTNIDRQLLQTDLNAVRDAYMGI